MFHDPWFHPNYFPNAYWQPGGAAPVAPEERLGSGAKRRRQMSAEDNELIRKRRQVNFAIKEEEDRRRRERQLAHLLVLDEDLALLMPRN